MWQKPKIFSLDAMYYIKSIATIFGLLCIITLAFTVEAQNTVYSLNIPLKEVSPGKTIEISFQAQSGTNLNSDWVGLYEVGDRNTAYKSWKYTGGISSGSLTFTAPSEGIYEFRYLKNSGYTIVATSDTFKVVSPGSETNPPGNTIYQLTFKPRVVTSGQAIEVYYSAPTGSNLSSDWIGVYKIGANNSSYQSWKYTGSNQTGTLTFDNLSEGTYEFRYFKNNGYTLVATSEPFIVIVPGGGEEPVPPPPGSSSYKLTSSPATALSGQTLTVNFQAPGGDNRTSDWIGLYKAGDSNTAYKSWKYTGGVTSGTLTFTAPSEGTYEFRYLKNSRYNVVATSEPFMVVVSGGGEDPVPPPPGSFSYKLTSSPDTALSGQTLTVNFQAQSGTNLNSDWIGLYKVGDSNTAYKSWKYTGGVTSGTLTFTAPSEGTYEFRYLKNNGYTVVATSKPFIVSSPIASQCTITNLSNINNFPAQRGSIIAFGDSLTAGVGATGGQDYVSQLERKANITIINQGITGNNTRQALARLDTDVLANNPAVVIVWLGGNDIISRFYERAEAGLENISATDWLRLIALRLAGLIPQSAGITEAETFDNITKIIEQIQATGAVTIVVGFSGSFYDSTLEGKYATVAANTGSLYVPNALSGIIGRPRFMSDIVHPNNTGYGLVADRILPYLNCVLPK